MKKIKILMGVVFFSVILNMNTFGDEWKHNDDQWWYQYDDGSYPVEKWQEIDGRQYYFDGNGYMLSNTITPDGFRVGKDGTFPNNIYFRSNWNNNTLIKIKDMIVYSYNRDGSGERVLHKLTAMPNGSIYKGTAIIGDWIYIQGTPIEDPQATLFRMKLDGSNLQVLFRQEYQNMYFAGEGIYFNSFKSFASLGDDDSIYSYNFMKFNGSGITEINKEEFDLKTNSNFKSKMDAPDSLYGFIWTSTNNDKKLSFYKINSDSTRTEIYQIPATRDENYYGLGYNSNLFYYYKLVTTATQNMWVTNKKTTLCSINLHTKEVKEYVIDENLAPYPGNFYVSDQYIFCTSKKTDNYSLYRMNLDGSGIIKISNGDGNEKKIIGGYNNFVYWGENIINGDV